MTRPGTFRINLSLVIIVVGLTAISALHYLTPISLFSLHNVYRSLYYLPIIYAAFVFGLPGGVVTALTAGVLYAPHVMLYVGALPTEATNDLLEIMVFAVVGSAVGWVSDAERGQQRRLEATAQELSASNAELEERAQAYRAMQEYTANVLDSLSCGVVTLDPEGRVSTCNLTATRMLGRSPAGLLPAEALGREIGSRLAEGEMPAYFQAELAGRPVGVHAARLRAQDGRLFGTVVVLDDLTEVKGLEEQVRRAEALAAVGRLAGGLAHEIRNPLGIVRASAQMLFDEVADPGVKECTQVIRQEVDRVNDLIQQLLDFSCPRPVVKSPLEVSKVVEGVVSLVQAYATQQGVAIETRLEPALPPVNGDEERLRQSLVNLLLNAVQAMPKGGRVLVEASHRKGDARAPYPCAVEIAVADQGHGIPREDLPRVFEPFFSTKAHGTGLGLAIALQVAHEHGGDILVESQVGKGSTFHVIIPCEGTVAADTPALPPEDINVDRAVQGQ